MFAGQPCVSSRRPLRTPALGRNEMKEASFMQNGRMKVNSIYTKKPSEGISEQQTPVVLVRNSFRQRHAQMQHETGRHKRFPVTPARPISSFTVVPEAARQTYHLWCPFVRRL